MRDLHASGTPAAPSKESVMRVQPPFVEPVETGLRRAAAALYEALPALLLAAALLAPALGALA
jgi:hypothetical protein